MKLILQSIRQLILWTLVTGALYPLVMTVACQALFPRQAAGSLVLRDGKVVGSKFIAQQFSGPTYFWPRPSAGNSSPVAGAPNAYATVPSGASNLRSEE